MTLPLKADVRHGIRRWGMLGNGPSANNPAPYKAGLGDCVEAMFLHLCMVDATTSASSWKKVLYRLGFKVPTPTWAIGLYGKFLSTQGETLAQDPGTVAPTFFQWLQDTGQIAGWGALTLTADRPATLANCHQAMIDYNGIGYTMELTPNSYTDFLGSDRWHISPNQFDQPNPGYQHAVAGVAYGPLLDGLVSWGRMKSATREFMYLCLNGAYVFVTNEKAQTPAGQALLARIKSL
ncbi:MAG: hypothetical protein KGL35_28470 [Bradyrhizobium sp.]|nr:hypothetical protein [Bradyrhizobium sp.]